MRKSVTYLLPILLALSASVIQAQDSVTVYAKRDSVSADSLHAIGVRVARKIQPAVLQKKLDSIAVVLRTKPFVAQPTPTNTAPTALFTVLCDSAGVCAFNGTASSDAESAITYRWTIGLSNPEPTTATTTQTYLTSGTKTASLTVTDAGGLTGTVSHSFTVTIAAAVATVTLSPTSASITAGTTQQFTATLKDASNNTLTGRTVGWSSTNPSVGTVSATGLATGVGAGSVSITATSEGQSGSAVLTVTSIAPSCSVVKDWTARSTTALGKPGYRQSVAEPDFGTTITRITGDPGMAIGGGVTGNWPTVARHEYAKDEVWSSDQKLLVLKEMQGTGFSLFIDGTTYAPLFSRAGPPGGGEWRMHPTKPDTVIYVNLTGPVAGLWNVRTNTSVTKFTTSGYTNARIGSNEGNVSADGRYVAINATRTSDAKLVAFVIDLVNGTKTGDIDVAGQGVSALDWVSVDQSGNYLILLGTVGGVAQVSKVYNRATLALVSTWSDLPLGHFDYGKDAAGNDVAFGRASSGTYNSRFVMRQLSNNTTTPLSVYYGGFSYHASTRALTRPGWGEASIDPGQAVPITGELIFLKMDGSTTIERWGHHRSTQSTYWSQAQAVPSPDGKRILFASDWGTAGGPIQTFVASCP